MKQISLLILFSLFAWTAQAQNSCVGYLARLWRCDAEGPFYHRVDIANPSATGIDIQTSHGTNEQDQIEVEKHNASFDLNAPFVNGEKYTAECVGSSLVYKIRTDEKEPGEFVQLTFARTHTGMDMTVEAHTSLNPHQPLTNSCVPF